MEETFTTNTECGNIEVGTTINSTDNCNDVIYNMMYTTNPNKRYESKSLGTWSSTTDVDTFLNTYNHNNNYGNLSLGNYISIPATDTGYDIRWEIVGFDMEYNQTAADGTTYNNGYGICMMPKEGVNKSAEYGSLSSYLSCSLHRYINGTVYNQLKTILGSHIVNRNVLLASAVDNSGSYEYTWTTAYGTCISVGQAIGTFASHNNKYDDGEANYKLPIFNYENYWLDSSSHNYSYYTRNSYSKEDAYVFSYGNLTNYTKDNWCRTKPMIYIR